MPEHSHHNEQLTYILEGALKFWIDGKEIVVHAGETALHPVEHAAQSRGARRHRRPRRLQSSPRRLDQQDRPISAGREINPAHASFHPRSAPGVRPAGFRFRCIALRGSQRQRRSGFPLSALRRPAGNHLSALERSQARRCATEIHLAHSGGSRSRPSISAECGVSASCFPARRSDQAVITLREGNTPLYELPQCARITGVPRLFAKHQGMNPTGSFKDAGMTVAATFARLRRIPLGRLRFHRQHFGVDGRLRRSRRHAQPGAGSRRQDFLEQTFAGARLRRGHLPVAHRLRRLPAPAAGTGSARARLPAEFDQSFSSRRPENAGARTAGATRLAAARPHHCSRRQPGKQFRHRQGAAGNARPGPDLAPAEVVGDSGRRRQCSGAHPSRGRR